MELQNTKVLQNTRRKNLQMKNKYIIVLHIGYAESSKVGKLIFTFKEGCGDGYETALEAAQAFSGHLL